ncbi:hypothetical protein Bhyg_07914 [Pseudolycoriella hygida]|uniref:THAP-type domain-containing protein n=1 Tax=Pseudolycoriella hygida TaxID=35572 RepID=A0A9Q0S3U0_9DIPT|nr:hypothetical protein Bhyg_07914 [Pseudolycoriella hygida]
MAPKCVVRNCSPLKGATFHRIPSSIHARKVWLDLLNLPEKTTGRNASSSCIIVCIELHLMRKFSQKQINLDCQYNVWAVGSLGWS